jgi:plasmid maintenance system antidote protein VapI
VSSFFPGHIVAEGIAAYYFSVMRHVPTFGEPLFLKPVTPKQFRGILEKLGLTQAEAARRMRVDTSTVFRWASGRRRIPGIVVSLLESWLREQAALDALAAQNTGREPRKRASR